MSRIPMVWCRAPPLAREVALTCATTQSKRAAKMDLARASRHTYSAQEGGPVALVVAGVNWRPRWRGTAGTQTTAKWS
eukprot:scaffold931_cov117-Isochrysis_galbana.AAC.2